MVNNGVSALWPVAWRANICGCVHDALTQHELTLLCQHVPERGGTRSTDVSVPDHVEVREPQNGGKYLFRWISRTVEEAATAESWTKDVTREVLKIAEWDGEVQGEAERDVCRRKGSKQKEGSYQSVGFKESEESLRRQKQSKKSLKHK